MATAKINMVIPTGISWRRTLIWMATESERRNLSGLGARLDVRPRRFARPFFSLSTDDDTILLGQDEVNGDATGTITLIIPGELTAAIRVNAAIYDLKL